MILFYRCKICFRIILYILFISFNAITAWTQIKVFERPTDSELRNTGLFFESDTRKRIDLNGQWDISFNEGTNFSKFIVPIAYDYIGNALFRNRFIVSEDIINSYSFIFVAEGIDYESEVKINNNFVSNHTAVVHQ